MLSVDWSWVTHTVASPWCWVPAGRLDYKIVPMLVTMIRSESFLKP